MPRSLPYDIVAFQRVDGLAQVWSTGALHDPLFQSPEKSRGTSAERISLPGPVKRVSTAFVPLVDVAVEGVGELVNSTKAGVLEEFSLQETEPNFDLVEPRGMGRSEMKIKTLVVATIPVASLCAIVSVQVIQHQMDLPSGVGVGDLVEERQKVWLLPGRVTPAQQLSSAYIEAGK
jgi:hypothetical protein